MDTGVASSRAVRTVCPYCGVGCGITAQVEGEQIVSLAGDPAHPVNRGMLCAKGLNLRETIHAPDRLLYPQVRAYRRAPFNEASWGQALERASSAFADIIREHGPESVAFYVSGQLLTEDYYVFNKLMKGFIGSNNIDSNSRLCMSSAVVGYKRAFGMDGPPACYDDVETADNILIFGANPAIAHPVLFRRIEKVKSETPGMRVVVADPRRTGSCSVADLRLPIRPGTDVALLQAMLNVMIRDHQLDREFIESNTTGFEAVQASAEKMTPEKAASICGVNTADIIKAATWFTQGKTLSLWSMGFNQSVAGSDKNNALLNLHLATGQIGKPGCGPFSLTGQCNAMGGRQVGGLSNLLPAHRELANRKDREEVARFWGVERIAEKPGYSAVELVEALDTGKVKAVWIVCTNPAVSMPDSLKVERALSRARFVVVSDIRHPTDTTRFADVLLPAMGWLEKEGTMTNAERRISLLQKAIPAPGDCLPDWEIARRFALRLGAKLGADWSSAFDYTKAEEIFDEHKRMTKGRNCDISGLNYESLKVEGSQQWPCPEGAKSGTSRLYTDGRFETPGNKARFVDISFRQTAERTNGEYPLSLTTGRIRDQWHTMTRTGRIPALTACEPIPTLRIHPFDAELNAVKEGDLVTVTSRRGEALVPVHLDDSLRPGVIFLPMHWGTITSVKGRANNLTISAFDKMSKQAELKHCAVRVERCQTAWRGGVLIAGDRLETGRQIMRDCRYGAVALLGKARLVTWVDIADDRELAPERIEMMDKAIGAGNDSDIITYIDEQKGIHRKILFDGEHLTAVRWIGKQAPDIERFKRFLLNNDNVADIRQRLLAPQ